MYLFNFKTCKGILLLPSLCTSFTAAALEGDSRIRQSTIGGAEEWTGYREVGSRLLPTK